LRPKEAVATSADWPDRSDRRAALVNLAAVLLTRLWTGGPEAELGRVLDLVAAALDLGPGPADQHAALLSMLGEARLLRHRRSGALADMDAAVDALDEAVAYGAARPLRECANLGVALSERALISGSADDLERAVDLLDSAVTATAAHAPERGTGWRTSASLWPSVIGGAALREIWTERSRPSRRP
jgi:hypothetical protein